MVSITTVTAELKYFLVIQMIITGAAAASSFELKVSRTAALAVK